MLIWFGLLRQLTYEGEHNESSRRAWYRIVKAPLRKRTPKYTTSSALLRVARLPPLHTRQILHWIRAVNRPSSQRSLHVLSCKVYVRRATGISLQFCALLGVHLLPEIERQAIITPIYRRAYRITGPRSIWLQTHSWNVQLFVNMITWISSQPSLLGRALFYHWKMYRQYMRFQVLHKICISARRFLCKLGNRLQQYCLWNRAVRFRLSI